MVEVIGILLALGALLLGLLMIGWAYGDFRRRPGAGQSPRQIP